MRAAPLAASAALLACSAVLLCGAAPADPDWPCVQRLVPTLSAGSLWAGPPPASDWKADPAVAALVAAASPRDVPADDAVARIGAFLAEKPSPEQVSEAFAGLADQTNAQRAEVIARLRETGRRQRTLADTTQRVTSELRALPPDAPDARRQEVADRRAIAIREYQSIDRTLQYACDVPVQLERRLGRFAQTMQDAGAR